MTEFETAARQAEAQGQARKATLMRRATYASVSVAGILIVVKLAAWLLTGSVAMLSTLIDSLLDAFASLVNLFAVRQALTPPDREHRFGHGKAEPLAALAQAAFITGSAIFLLVEAGKRLYAPQPVASSDIGIGVMVFSIVLTLILVRYQRFVVRRTDSLAISADSLHYAGDVLVNIAVIVALVIVSQFDLLWVDPVFALGIAAYIVWNAWQIARGAMDMLMDRELEPEERQIIKDIVMAHPDVLSLHELKTRAAGPQKFIQLHIEMSGAMSLWRAHVVSDTVEAELQAAFPDAEILIHQDPFGIEEESSAVR
ncbi:cation diffusion facilitator family transporter [Limibacillus sp. MBR-115]|jgi:ferrous-iron efflux pump FieF|uniref:cation diffusion facilitator family transporter n=1 Tax=Limibacillus sp. MBR-115 TaxID=3156465 RepID=UPI003394B483